MKKTSLVIFLLVAAFQLKAQHGFKLKPVDSLSTRTENYFKITPAPGLIFKTSAFEWKQNPLVADASNNFLNKDGFDNMFIVSLFGRDNMPIVKLGGYDRMPMLDLGTPKSPEVPNKGLPGMPTFFEPSAQN